MPVLIIAHEPQGASVGSCQCSACADLSALARGRGWTVIPQSELLRRRQASRDALMALLRQPDLVIAVGPGTRRAAVARALGLPPPPPPPPPGRGASADARDCLSGLRLASFDDVARVAGAAGATGDALARLEPWVEPAPPPPPADAPRADGHAATAAGAADPAGAGAAGPNRPARAGRFGNWRRRGAGGR